MPARPLFSIVMPSYNHAAYVTAAVKSVLEQTIDDLELIIIDDGSSDRSPAILTELVARDSRAQLFSRANKGAPATINEGISCARGKWIGIINSDDVYYSNRLELMLEAVERNGTDWGFSRVDFIDAEGKPAPDEQASWYRGIQSDIRSTPTVGYALLKHNMTITTGNLFFAYSLFDLLGPFRDLQLVHDWDFALRLLCRAEPVYVDQALYSYRLHEQNTIRKIAQTTTDREVNYVLRDFFLSVTLAKPANTLAPNPYTWPGYFEEVVQRLDFQSKPYSTYMPSQQERSFLQAQAGRCLRHS
jgi:glycosyltransferase involved in cell wall biosynthesis